MEQQRLRLADVLQCVCENLSITNKTSGKVYNLSQADYRTNPNTNTSYLNYNKGGYGINSCLIFNIGANNISNAELN